MTDQTADKPPVAKYTLTVKITGNSHDEIERAIHYFNNGGYLLDSDYHKRDEFYATDGTTSAKLVHSNPSMTPERYRQELDEWFERLKASRKAARDV